MHYNILFKVCDHKGIDLSCFVVKTKPTTVFRAILNALYTATDAQYVFNVANDTLGFFLYSEYFVIKSMIITTYFKPSFWLAAGVPPAN